MEGKWRWISLACATLAEPPEIPFRTMLGIVVRSIAHQGILSSYRKAYWKFLLRLVARWSLNPAKFSMGFAMLLSGHHFIHYARNLVVQLDCELDKFIPYSKELVERGEGEILGVESSA